MFVATVVVSILLAVILLASGFGKLAKQKQQLETMRKVKFPLDKLWLLAAAEIAGAAGLIIGLFWWPLGVAAAIGVILYFVGAIGSHLRVRDSGWPPAAVLLLLAAAALVLRLMTV
jgi:uncharacterized membrane protein YphA (DoxX/SURF4 family)